ncbi:MAG: Asp-tRNA(Asn)/Glu-tRNA(Gln) amidotransferase subunit GatA [Planctomycetes bacterium]|nr:Asp-tRNA(Asn)/Glu-tRNA(Gln) amidotransferase subunit GatA [Planctomycetota bacterium]
MPFDLLKSDATSIAQAVRDGSVSAETVVSETIKRMAATEPKVGAFLQQDAEGALAQARAIDAARKQGKPVGRLAGVPIAIKDNIHVEGRPTTCASRILDGFIAPYDATVTTRLRAEGAVIVGKTNLDEFAMGSSCENSALKQTRNPWDVTRVPGGSSGGSAAAVAARSALVSLGTDTGGSIRLPGSFCGVVGMKPSYGRVSRYGAIAFASSLDQIGPLSVSVRDSALTLSIMAGRDDHDATSSKRAAPDYVAELAKANIKGLRVGYVPAYFDQCPDKEVAKTCKLGLERLRNLGATLVEVNLPNADHGIEVYYVVASAEASSNLSRFDGVRYGMRADKGNAIANYFATRGAGFGTEVKRRIMLGTYALSAGAYDEYYGRASKVRTLIVNDFVRAFGGCDLIVGPTVPFTAFKAGEKSDPLSMYLCDIYTIPASLAGLCALSLPAGFSKAGLPIGLHLQAPPYAETTLFAAAQALERDLGLDRLAPIA